MSVVDFGDEKVRRSPHWTGHARCRFCGKEWQAVAPVDTTILECPECGNRSPAADDAPRARGVAREDGWALTVYFDKDPADDYLRWLHDLLRGPQ